MRIRAAVFDIYKTILEVGPPPSDREVRWEELWREMNLAAVPRLSLAEFGLACEARIAREHAAARNAGIPFPEIFWPEVVCNVLPEVAGLPEPRQDEFIFRHTGLSHTVRLMPGAAAVLLELRARGTPVGIASNAQPYTLRELSEALAPAGLSLADFAEDLRFWSFAHGFSKPDPHVFRLLGARLRARGISVAEAVLVGDRRDNDVIPARVQGWQTWHLAAGPDGVGGSWTELQRWLG